jgi:hypothetical protein
MGEDRLVALAECRPWALSDPELVAALDLAHALRVEAEAVSIRLLREFDARKAAAAVGASSTAVWYRNRHLGHSVRAPPGAADETDRRRARHRRCGG